MKLKGNVLVATLATFCITILLFATVPVIGQPGEYDPWLDINDDGYIGIDDLFTVASHFGSEAGGDAMNKTALLIYLNSTCSALLTRMDNLNASLIELDEKIDNLNATNLMPLIDSLNASLLELHTEVTSLNSSVTTLQGSNASLWISLAQLQYSINAINNTLSSQMLSLETQMLTMNATLTEIEIGYHEMNSTLTEHQSRIDTLNTTILALQAQIMILQSQMNLLNNSLTLIWDSDWIGPTSVGDTVILFNQTLNITDAVVYMVGKKTVDGAPHQMDYGGYQNVASFIGAYWWNLKSTSITFHRHGNDVDWVYVRIMIYRKIML